MKKLIDAYNEKGLNYATSCNEDYEYILPDIGTVLSGGRQTISVTGYKIFESIGVVFDNGQVMPSKQLAKLILDGVVEIIK